MNTITDDVAKPSKWGLSDTAVENAGQFLANFANAGNVSDQATIAGNTISVPEKIAPVYVENENNIKNQEDTPDGIDKGETKESSHSENSVQKIEVEKKITNKFSNEKINKIDLIETLSCIIFDNKIEKRFNSNKKEFLNQLNVKVKEYGPYPEEDQKREIINKAFEFWKNNTDTKLDEGTDPAALLEDKFKMSFSTKVKNTALQCLKEYSAEKRACAKENEKTAASEPPKLQNTVDLNTKAITTSSEKEKITLDRPVDTNRNKDTTNRSAEEMRKAFFEELAGSAAGENFHRIVPRHINDFASLLGIDSDRYDSLREKVQQIGADRISTQKLMTILFDEKIKKYDPMLKPTECFKQFLSDFSNATSQMDSSPCVLYHNSREEIKNIADRYTLEASGSPLASNKMSSVPSRKGGATSDSMNGIEPIQYASASTERKIVDQNKLFDYAKRIEASPKKLGTALSLDDHLVDNFILDNQNKSLVQSRMGLLLQWYQDNKILVNDLPEILKRAGIRTAPPKKL